MRIICSSVAWLVCLAVYCQTPHADTVLISQVSQNRLALHEYARIFNSTTDLKPVEAWEESFHHSGRTSASVGFTKDYYWVAFSLHNDHHYPVDLLIEIGSPQIDKIFWYAIQHDHDSLLTTTGDRFPFKQRLVWNKNFLFPVRLKAGETQSYLFKVDKRNTSLYLPVFLWPPTAFEKHNQSMNLIYGAYFGVVALYCIFGLFAFLFIKNVVYLWYFLWILLHGLYISANLGFSFQFLYPTTSNLSGPLFSYTTYLAFICFVVFSLHYLKAKKAAPKPTWAISALISILLFIIVTSIPFFDFYMKISFIVLQFINVLIISICLLLFYVVYRAFKQNRAIAGFYIGAFGIRVVNMVVVVFIEFGFFKTDYPMSLPSIIGSTLEMTTLALGFIYQIKTIYQERNEFLNKINLQKKEMLSAFIDGADKERHRLAMDLHDNIGSRMSNLTRLFKNSESMHKMEEQINILCDEIRVMSHELSPTSLKYIDLVEKLKEFIASHNAQNKVKIDFQFYDFPQAIDENIKLQLYRVLQEIFENIFKHARATEVDLQLFKHDDVLVAAIEDNGIGFDPSEVKNGAGLNNMKARIESMSGTIEITSGHGRGVQILIRIPI